MSLRFRKSINLGGGVRVNFSKSGVGYSFGTKGARITKTAKGRTRTTLGIPNTGLSYITESNNKSKKNAKSNIKLTKNTMNMGNNMFSKFNLTEKELELIEFVLKNEKDLEEGFSIHDISCMGCVISNTYYNKLYDKGLFLKPSRGKYELNKELLAKLVKEKEEEQKRIEELERKRREKRTKNLAWVCRICFVPMIVLGLLYLLVEPMTGLFSIGIGIIEFLYSKNYFKKNKIKENDIK